MTHVVAEPCVNCKFTDCVEVCPVDAFREGENCLVIAPDECIDCTLCVSQCPVSAIYMDSDLPSQWAEWLELNARFSRVWPVITKKKEAMPEHEVWAKDESKRLHLFARPGPEIDPMATCCPGLRERVHLVLNPILEIIEKLVSGSGGDAEIQALRTHVKSYHSHFEV